MDPLEQIIAHGNRASSAYGWNWGPNWLRCADGYVLSVVAGAGTYCQPRPALSERTRMEWECAPDYPGPYTHVEVGYLSAKPEPYEPWQALGGEWEDADVFGFVPVDLVRELVASHGGVVSVHTSEREARA